MCDPHTHMHTHVYTQALKALGKGLVSSSYGVYDELLSRGGCQGSFEGLQQLDVQQERRLFPETHPKLLPGQTAKRALRLQTPAGSFSAKAPLSLCLYVQFIHPFSRASCHGSAFKYFVHSVSLLAA